MSTCGVDVRRVALEIDRADVAEQRCEAVRVTGIARRRETDRRVGLHRTTDEHDGGSAATSAAQSGSASGRPVRRPVEHDTERTFAVVLEHEHDGAEEVRVLEIRRRDEELPSHQPATVQ